MPFDSANWAHRSSSQMGVQHRQIKRKGALTDERLISPRRFWFPYAPKRRSNIYQ